MLNIKIKKIGLDICLTEAQRATLITVKSSYEHSVQKAHIKCVCKTGNGKNVEMFGTCRIKWRTTYLHASDFIQIKCDSTNLEEGKLRSGYLRLTMIQNDCYLSWSVWILIMDRCHITPLMINTTTVTIVQKNVYSRQNSESLWVTDSKSMSVMKREGVLFCYKYLITQCCNIR